MFFKKKTRNMLQFLFIISLLMLFVGCNSSDGGDNQTQENEGANKEGLSDYPEEPIELVIPYSAGGGTDITGRAIENGAKDILDQPLTITNRDGAAGTIGTAEVADADPDGYTILLDPGGPFITQPYLKEINYSLDDFRGVIGLTVMPLFLLVQSDSPWESIEDLANETEPIKFSHGGEGTFGQLALSAFFDEAGVDAEGVPYEGSKPAQTALLGGHADVSFGHPSEVKGYTESGDIKLLGIFSDERFDNNPDVPTFTESGYDIEMNVYNFIIAPKDTPDEEIEYLQDAFAQAKESEVFQEYLKDNDIEDLDLNGEELIEKLKSDAKDTSVILEDLGYENVN